MKYKLRCLLLCFLFIFSLQGCQKETKLEKPGNLITTTKNSSKENPNTEDPVETVPITGGQPLILILPREMKVIQK